MAIALANSEKASISSASSGTTTGVTTTTGSTFLIAVADFNAAVTVSDNKGNTYSQVGTDQSSGIVVGQLWKCENGVGGAAHTATVTFTSGTGDCGFYFLEISGAATASFDSAVTAQGTDAATPYTITSGTPAQAAELVVCLIWCDGNSQGWNAGGSFTLAEEEGDGGTYWTSAIGTRIISSAAAVTPSWTTNNVVATCGLIVAGFKEAASGASITGTGALTISAATASGAGVRGSAGTGAAAITQATVAGSGTASPPGITFFGAASNPADAGSLNDAALPIVLTPPASMVANDLVVVRVAFTDTTTTRDIAISNTGGQTWTQGTLQDGSPLNECTFWCTFNGTWSANPSWTHGGATIPAAMSVLMEVFRPSANFVAWTVDVAQSINSYVAPSGPFDVTITGRTAIANSTVTTAAWIGGGNQTWTLQTGGWSQPQAQFRNNPLSISTAYKIQTAAGATGNVTNRQNSGASGWGDIITFADSLTAPVTGTGALTIGAATAAGAGAVGHTGAGAPAITNATVAGSGTHSGVPQSLSGTGNSPITNTTSAGAGARGSNDVPGDIALTLTGFTAEGSGTVTPPGGGGAALTGSGALALANVTVLGSVTGGHPGSGALDIPAPTVAGTGALGHVGSGALTLPAFQIIGTNIPRSGRGRGVSIRLGLGF